LGIDVAGEIVDVDKEQERTKYGTLGDTRCYWMPVRINTIKNNSLVSVREIAAKPREKRSKDAITVQF
jgi:hypothetical protein